jgi:hypothetical protein
MYGYDSPEDLLGDLTDISRQLYVEAYRQVVQSAAMKP